MAPEASEKVSWEVAEVISCVVRLVAVASLLALTVATAAQAAPGDLDASFDGDGFRIVDVGASDHVNGLLVQPDGKLVATGDALFPTGLPFMVADFMAFRLNLNGSLDTDFDGDGKTSADLGNLAAADVAWGAALQPDGKIVVAGEVTGTNVSDIALLRLTSAGLPDPTFDGDGRHTLDYGGGVDFALDVLVQPDGRLVIAGAVFNDMAAIREQSDGAQDTGARIVDFGGGSTSAAEAVALQPDGKIVMAGEVSAGAGGTDIAVARLNADLSPDTSFDEDGRRTIDLGGSDHANDVIVQPDGKIVLAGEGLADRQIIVVRLNPNGSLDTSFAGDGTASIDVGDAASGNDAALQANGKLVVAGQGEPNQPLLVRLQPGGALDTTFGDDGQQTVPAAGSAAAVALLRDGRIAVAGTSAGDALVAVLEGDSAGAGGGPVATGPGGGPSGGGKSRVPRCAGRKATIVGTGKSNRLNGTRRADVIVALGGSDRIDAGRGNDVVCAGDGNDRVKGGDGNDRVYGQNGKDKLGGGTGNDALSGGNGSDSLGGGGGKDRLTGGSGRDRCDGGTGTDRAACERKKGL